MPGMVLPKSTTLFPRIDMDKLKKPSPEPDHPQAVNSESKPFITLETLRKVDLRVGTVIRAEAIPRAKKLLKLEVDIGETRIIVAGIAENYTPEDLVDKQVIVVANLKPAKLMGILSNGMLLAAVDENGNTIATLEKKVTPGTPLE